MSYDYLIENATREVFHLMPHTNDGFGLLSAATAERLPNLLAETELTDSFVAEYASQLAMRGAVDRDLLIVEGRTIAEELDVLSERMRMVDATPGSGFLYEAELPEDEEILMTFRHHFGLKILDRNGYSNPDLSPFSIEGPSTPGGSFIKPGPIWKYFFRKGMGVPSVEYLKDIPTATHGMEQYAVTRDEHGMPVRVSSQPSIVVGCLNASGGFGQLATFSGPFRY